MGAGNAAGQTVTSSDSPKKHNLILGGRKKMREIIWLKKKGFEQEGDTWTKILEGAELIEYFEDDTDTIDKIETGEIQAAYVEIYPEEKTVIYILFEQYPRAQDIAEANIIHEDYYPCVMEWIQKV